MSIIPMTHVTLIGPEKMVNTAIAELVVDHQFHMTDAIKALEGYKRLFPFDNANPYGEELLKAKFLLSSMDISPCYVPYSNMGLNLKSVREKLTSLAQEVKELSEEQQKLNELLENESLQGEELSHFESLDIGVNILLNLKYVKFRFGRVPEDIYDELMENIDGRDDVYFIASGSSNRHIYGAYFALKKSSDVVDNIFLNAGFQRTRIQVEDNVESTMHEISRKMEKEQDRAKLRLFEIELRLKDIKLDEGNNILKYFCWLKFMSEAREMRSLAAYRHGKFYITGFIPTNRATTFKMQCDGYENFTVSFVDAEKNSQTNKPPILLSHTKFSSVYEPFVEMYGLPKYGTIDPRFFMALTYTLLFGIMFGDVGQGAFLCLVGLALWKFKQMWLGRIVALCGISATCFGFFYGSIFGNEEILHGFNVLHDGNTMKILLIAVAIGVLLLLTCMILNVINGIKEKDIKKIFFEPNGLAGFILYGGIALGVVLMFVKDINVFTLPYILLVIVLPFFLIFAASPLTKLLKGDKDWKPKSVGMFLVEGFFELFETVLSYVSNTVSFLRVGAFAISHAGMMMVVYLLSGSEGDYSLIGLILGNILVTGLETVLVCIQVMRLEFYEMFGRFYDSEGIKFAPKIIDYTISD